MGCEPDGRNINLNSGALHVENLRLEVLKRGADVGIAFDGDADRAILVSHSGKIIDGDSVLLVVANALQETGKLAGIDGTPVVVATVMSNLGLERALSQSGIQLVRTPVGDKYVLEEMVRRGAIIGGEQSGHVIFRDFATTGDGMLTALRVLEVVKNTGRDLDDLTSQLHIYPQLLVNVRVKNRKPLVDMPGVQSEIRTAEQSFGDAGRVLVRFSGTEPLARVMVEGPDLLQVEHFAGGSPAPSGPNWDRRKMRTALIAGATGLIGGACLERLLADSKYRRVIAIVRRPLTVVHPKLESHVTDFDQLETLEPAAIDDVFCALGSTIKKAGSEEAFRKIDLGYPKALCTYAKRCGAVRVALVSSVGADASSSNFYLRVKGETEAAIEFSD